LRGKLNHLMEHPETAAVHAGTFTVPQNVPASPPLYQAAAYRFKTLDEVEAVYDSSMPGIIYGRYGGPNGAQFADAIATLEGAELAVAAASGMAAIDAALTTNVPHGASIVATRDIYGGTFDLLKHEYGAGRANVVYVDTTNLEQTAAALEQLKPRVLYTEALTNPLVHVPNLPELAKLAHLHNALLVVDATFASPVLIQPILHGTDIVIHSVTKYIGGHGDVGAGVLAGRADLIGRAQSYLIRTGATIPHFESWLALRGLRTLALRMAQHSKNANAIAAFLAAQPDVLRVHHPSQPSHPQHDLANTLYPHGFGGMLSFDIAGGRDAVDLFLRGLKRIEMVHSLGEIGTTISYSAVSSHRNVPADVRAELGVTDGTLRISAGIEHADDIIADLKGAFAGLSSRVHA
jgi:cystathionine gamma-synthase